MNKRNSIKFGLFGALVAGSVGLLVPMITAEESADAKLRDKLQIDDSEVRREGVFASYADMLDQVRPSIVSIYSTKKVELRRMGNPFFNDPMLRRFFGIPDSGQGNDGAEVIPQTGLGSGVVITADGYILTNNHVVEGADEIKVKFADRKKQYEATLIGADPESDIAVIKVEGDDLPHATLGNSTKVRVGDVVLAIGSPLYFEQTVTMGIVSALSRNTVDILPNGGYEDFIQTDAAINQGNSGGALIDSEGRVIGINTAIASRSGGNIGIGFAIPINMAIGVAEALVDDGEVQRGFLGIGLSNVDENMASYLKLDGQRGALVQEVREGTPAAEAGFKELDVVTEFDGRRVDDAEQLRLWVGSKKPGAEVKFRIVRGGEEKELSAVLAKRDASAIAGMAPESSSPAADEFLEGVAVSNLTPELRNEFSIGEDVTGIVVQEVAAGSAAYESGLRAGDVITEIDRQPVDSVRDAVKLRKNANGEVLLAKVVSQGVARFLAINLE